MFAFIKVTSQSTLLTELKWSSPCTELNCTKSWIKKLTVTAELFKAAFRKKNWKENCFLRQYLSKPLVKIAVSCRLKLFDVTMLEKNQLKITCSCKMIVLFRMLKQLPINVMVKLKELIRYVFLISTLESHHKIAQN